MPKKDRFHGYMTAEGEFYSKFKNKRGEATPKMYQEELEKYIKKCDSDYIINNFANFIINTSNGVINPNRFDNTRILSDEYKNLVPYKLTTDYLVETTRPTPKLINLLKQNCSKEAYLRLCQSVGQEATDQAKLAYKIELMKTAEALKPTGNAFTNFFKRLFNINGYNDKMAAYQTAKENLRVELGDRVTDEQYLDLIQNPEKHSELYKIKQKSNKVKINVEELEQVKEEQVQRVDSDLVYEDVIELEVPKSTK